MRVPIFAVTALMIAACALLAGTATAAAPYATKVLLSEDVPYWHGSVISAGSLLHGVAGCERKRLVKVYRRRDGKDRLIGSDLSNHAGRWAVSDKPTKGIYYAKVTERRPGDEPGCERDQSGIVFVD